ncbi:protein-tyrosine phosphatase family protein [Denitrobaculum tricleocarpae]|uniref:Tyrosine specific protein phosphatases domain-containing protein n=1 Tax=Denitrobaculum tricleocarpae TaxID=2591009 RepID=A0A545TN65_9PROT|nr:dual specificity protein phosphatase family protein [Denitrobaculum tricleocarpae]TQV78636.1 hypothetical protein FKG95_18995 [Denitrobaculum tricleocarpae]
MSTVVRDCFSYADLALPGTLGIVALMSCPGARAGQAADANPAEDLQRDFSVISSRGLRMVVSCLEPRELPLEPQHYQGLYEKERIDWEIVPIPDYHAPSPTQDTLLTRLFDSVDLRLRFGEKVGFHCYGGLGRTGTVVARYLIHKGLTPGEAIRYIRDNYNSRAIETIAQEEYLKLCRRPARGALAEPAGDASALTKE